MILFLSHFDYFGVSMNEKKKQLKSNSVQDKKLQATNHLMAMVINMDWVDAVYRYLNVSERQFVN